MCYALLRSQQLLGGTPPTEEPHAAAERDEGVAGARSRPCAASGLHRAPRAGCMLQVPQLRAECTSGRAPSKDEEVIVGHGQSRVEKRLRAVRRLHPDAGPACIRGPRTDQGVWRVFRSRSHCFGAKLQVLG